MEFASRYELGDLLLTTTVETFVASDLRSKERVLVHVFPASENGLNPTSSAEQVVRRFEQLTGASVQVRAAGLDTVTQYAYVVTSEIARDSIARWGAKKAGSAAAAPPSPLQEAMISAERPTAMFDPSAIKKAFPQHSQQPPPKPPLPPTPAAAPPGSFSQVFGEEKAPSPALGSADPFMRSDEVGMPAKAPAKTPGPFTREFMSLQENAPEAPVESRAAGIAAPAPPVPRPASSGSEFTRMFGGPPAAAADDNIFPAAPPAPAAKMSPPPHEAFRLSEELPAARSSEENFGPSDSLADALHLSKMKDERTPFGESPAKPQGAFTRMFGAGDAASLTAKPPAAKPATPNKGSFTDVFGASGEPAFPKPAAPAQGGAFTRMFGAGDAAALPPSAPPAEPRKSFGDVFGGSSEPAFPSPKPLAQSKGSFTEMFGGPAGEPAFPPPNPPTQQKGSFTNVFGTSAEPAAPPQPPAQQGGAFTRMFGAADQSALPAKPPQKAGAFTRMFDASADAPPTPAPPAPGFPATPPPNPSAFQPAPFPSSAAPAGKRPDATGFFGVHGAPAPQAPPPSGPSEYTRILSGNAWKPQEPAPAQVPGTAAPPAGAPPAMGAPQVNVQFPQGPGMPQAQVYPPQVYPPQVYPPQVYPPQMPYVAPVSVSAPQYGVPGVQYTPPSATVGPPSMSMGGPQGASPHAMGGPQGAAPEKRNWVPLIIVLNVLFLLAVLVVVIFALKGK